MKRRSFTLIELLVVISVIALLIGITLPALGSARESGRRVRCMVNLSSIGKALQLYMDGRSKGVLPLASGLLASTGRPTLPQVVGEFLDAPQPVQGPDGYFTSNEPWRCPSDIIGKDPATNLQPTWRVAGSSYEYWPGSIMLLADFIALNLARPEFSLTKMYQTRNWPVVADSDQWHKVRAGSQDRRDALYLDNGMRVDWCIPNPSSTDIFQLILDLQREPRLPGTR
jgi:prepilin-type N-terminal cleavage/methylation domain-containing protein